MADNNSTLQTISLTELLETKYEPITETVEGMLTPGLYILAGTPKVGKSFFSLQLAYALSKGEAILGKTTVQGRVLYLALEDSPQRLQSRIVGMFGRAAASDNLDLVTNAPTIEDGLIDQLEEYAAAHTDTKLIIIDTLQMVRTASSTYKSDYEDIGALKSFADNKNVCVLLIHHTTKARKADVFSCIAGSQGLRGAADGTLVLYRETDEDNAACLSVQGRDIPTETYHLLFDQDSMQWHMDDGESFIHPAVRLIGEGLTEEDDFEFDITASELFEKLPELASDGKSKLTTITTILNKNKAALSAHYGIEFNNLRTNKGRMLHFERHSAA